MNVRKAIADPFVSSLVFVGALGAAGMAVIVFAFKGTRESADVAEQVAYIVSGGLGGIALLGFASGLLIIEARRWAEARRRAQFDKVLQAAGELLTAARANPGERDR